MSITLHPLWPLLESHLVVEEYDRDGGHDRPRIRIEFRDLPPDLAVLAADALMKCVACGRRIFPLRQREGGLSSSLYYAPTCPIAGDIANLACSRSQPARDEYSRFRGLWGARPPVQLRLL